MTDSKKTVATAQTQVQGNGTDANIKSKDNGVIYFELSTGYYYVVDGATATAIEDENNRLQHLVETQINASKAFSDIQGQCLAAPKDQALNSKYRQLEQTLFDANKDLKNGLNFLEPLQASDDDKTKIHSLSEIGKDTEKLIEVLPIKKSAGKGKIIYVRPRLNKKRWEPYIPEQAESGKGSFIKNGKIDKAELHKQLKSVTSKIKQDWDIIDPKDHTGTLFGWAEKWNEGKNSHLQLHDDKEQSPDDHFDASFGAQLMRYTSGLGANIEFDPTKMEGQAKLSGNAEFAVWEAKGNFKIMHPHRLGWLPSVPRRDGKGDCVLGYLRIDLEVVATSSLGASITAELGIEINKKPDTQEKAGIRGIGSDYKPTPAPAERKIDLSKVAENSDVKAGIRAFAWFEAKGEVSGSVMWKEPDKMTSKNEDDYKAIAKIGESISYLAGAGFEATFQIKLYKGKLYVACHAGLCWGQGASGGIDFEVDAGQLFDFLKYVCYLLRDADYQKLSVIIIGSSFPVITKLILLSLVMDLETVRRLYNKGVDLDKSIDEFFADKKKRSFFIESISNNKELCHYTTPEIKGNMLAMLIEEDFYDGVRDILPGNQLGIKKGILNIFRWVQSKAEYRNVLQYCSLTLGQRQYPDWEVKMKQLEIRMYAPDITEVSDNWTSGTTIDSGRYGAAFEKIYNLLSELPMPGFPITPNDSLDYALFKNTLNKNYYDASERLV
ncbi:hypothetical protein [Rahnella sp. PCH160]|uniref:hypothetical protein n=1 Tax=Rahnella sp. PCH160 TaxID=3447928 RepID=UPI0039FDAD7F